MTPAGRLPEWAESQLYAQETSLRKACQHASYTTLVSKFTVHTYPELKSLVSPASRNDRPRLPLLALAVTFTPVGAWATGKPRAEVAKTAKARRDANDFMFVLVMFLTGKE